MNVIVDTSLSPRIARILDAAFSPRHRVLHASDVSGERGGDEAVAAHLQANAPSALLAQDLETWGQPHRMAALDACACHAVLLAPGWLAVKPTEQAWILTKVLPRVFKRLAAADRPLRLQITPGAGASVRELK